MDSEPLAARMLSARHGVNSIPELIFESQLELIFFGIGIDFVGITRYRQPKMQ